MAMKRKFIGRTIPKKPSSTKASEQANGAAAEVDALLMPVDAVDEGEGATVVLAEGLLGAAAEAGPAGEDEGEEGATMVLSADEVFELEDKGSIQN